MKKYIFLVLFLFISILTYSKEISIKVIDKDLKIPLEGVKITDRKTKKLYFTGQEGKALITIDDKNESIIIEVELIGYETKKAYVKELDKEVVLAMSIEGVLEGKELVIEEEAIGKTDEKVGVSLVVDKEELKSTAEVGMIEDVVSTIKTLPGVGFSNGFDSRLSVRGGYPDELTAVYDGFLIRYPYHWGGAYSIFNPNIVDSVKFSPGIFSFKHGQAMSGLLEVESVKPDEGLKFESLISTNTGEIFLQTPLGSKKNSGLFLGGRVTYTDLFFKISDSYKNYMRSISEDEKTGDDGMRYSQPPYIRDGYFKWYWQPLKRFEWYINGFFGSDGIGITYDETMNDSSKSDVKTYFNFNWTNIDTFGVTGFKILPTDNIFIHFLAGYEYLYHGLKAFLSEEGEKSYSNEFIQKYSPPSNKFTIKDNDSEFSNEEHLHSIQSRLDTDFTLRDNIIFSIGAGVLSDFVFYGADGEFYTIVFENGGPVYKKVKYKLDAEDKKLLKSFAYFGFNFDFFDKKIEIEVGCRLDHSIVYSSGFINGRINTYPVPGPRFNIRYSPVRNKKYLDQLTLSAGVGLFTKTPLQETNISKDLELKDFQIQMPKVLSTVLGTELKFPHGFVFKIEGYYKYYFDRFYANLSATNNSNDTTFNIHSDGIGHVTGFDILIQREISRYFDGWISYTFSYARFNNPKTDGRDDKTSIAGEPTGKWYYPSYHRFHIINVVFNIKPLKWMTITPTFTFATGVPRKVFGNKEMFAAYINKGEPNETIIEMYTRERVYSDTERTDISIPFDLKVAFHFYFPKSKVRLETYIAVEDLFSFVYSPKGGVSTNQYTGEEQPAPEANFALPMPIPSIGLKINF